MSQSSVELKAWMLETKSHSQLGPAQTLISIIIPTPAAFPSADC